MPGNRCRSSHSARRSSSSSAPDAGVGVAPLHTSTANVGVAVQLVRWLLRRPCRAPPRCSWTSSSSALATGATASAPVAIVLMALLDCCTTPLAHVADVVAAAPRLRARSAAPSVLPSSGTHASAPAGRPPRLPAHRGFNISAATKVFDRMIAREGRVVTSPW
jgi:hypothetical protein